MNPLKIPTGKCGKCVICNHQNTNTNGQCCMRCIREYGKVIRTCGIPTARAIHISRRPRSHADVMDLVAGLVSKAL